jgi:hypothetical protein
LPQGAQQGAQPYGPATGGGKPPCKNGTCLCVHVRLSYMCRLSLYVCVCVSARPSAHVLYMMLCVFCSMSECVCRCSSYLHVGTCLLSFQETEGALEHSQQVIKLTLTTTSPTLLASGNYVCGNCLWCECMWVRKSTHFSVLVCCSCLVNVPCVSVCPVCGKYCYDSSCHCLGYGQGQLGAGQSAPYSNGKLYSHIP